MATHSGYQGSLKIGGSTVAVVRSWSADVRVDEHDISDVTDDWKKRQPGLAEVTGTFEANFDETDVGLVTAKNSLIKATEPGTVVFLELFSTSSIKLAGSALISGLRFGIDVNDAQRFSGNFSSHKAWATSGW